MIVLRPRVRCLRLRQVAPCGRSLLLRYGHLSSSWLREGARGAAVSGTPCALLVYMRFPTSAAANPQAGYPEAG